MTGQKRTLEVEEADCSRPSANPIQFFKAACWGRSVIVVIVVMHSPASAGVGTGRRKKMMIKPNGSPIWRIST